MPPPSRCGLRLMYLSVLLILPGQVSPQCYRPAPRAPHVFPPCCLRASKARVRQPIVSCIEQRENAFPHCRIRAFIFTTADNRHWCVNPEAKWLTGKFQELEKTGVCCHRL